MQSLADTYTCIGRFSDAIVMFEQLLENAKTRLGPDDPELLEHVTRLAVAYRRAGDWQRAMRLIEQVVEKDEALRGPTAAGSLGRAHLLGGLYMDAGKYPEAAARLEKVMILRKALVGQDDNYLTRTCAYGYQRAGRLDEAGRLLRDLSERERKRIDSLGQVELARTLEMLSLNVLLQSRPAEAEALAREALALAEKCQTTEYEWRRPYVMNLLGGTLLAQKKYADAETFLLQGYRGMKQAEATMPAQWRFRLTEAGERVVRYYEETNQPEKARAWRERLLEDKSKK